MECCDHIHYSVSVAVLCHAMKSLSSVGWVNEMSGPISICERDGKSIDEAAWIRNSLEAS